jgi:hypothetical protein
VDPGTVQTVLRSVKAAKRFFFFYNRNERFCFGFPFPGLLFLQGSVFPSGKIRRNLERVHMQDICRQRWIPGWQIG